MTFRPDPKHKKKKRKQKRSIQYKLKLEILHRDGYQCSNPKCTGEGQNIFDIHHIKFRSQGGKNTDKNLILLCRCCHDKIHSRGTLKVTGEYPNVYFHKPEFSKVF